MSREILIVGLGNRLMGDDGVGVLIAEALRDESLPPGVRVEPLEGDALRIAGLWQGEREIWLVDALEGGGRPGTLRLVEEEEILALPQRHEGAHQPSLPESLRWLKASRPGMDRVRFRLWGIVPERVSPVEGLTPAVLRSVGETLRRMRAEIDRALLSRDG